MSTFDTVIMVDWSARSKPSPKKRTKDSIFFAEISPGERGVVYCRTRAEAHDRIKARMESAVRAGRRALVGFDFPFAYPARFAEALTGQPDAFAVWEWLSEAIEDDAKNGNNRLAVADRINAAFTPEGPFWSHPVNQSPNHVPFRKPRYDDFPFAEFRDVEVQAKGASSCFQLYGNGAVASQSLLGLPRLHALRRHFGSNLAVRPFETHDAPLILAEVYPSILSPQIAGHRRSREILDAAQVRVLAEAFAGLSPDVLDSILREGHPEEGWIAGLGHEESLIQALGPGGP